MPWNTDEPTNRTGWKLTMCQNAGPKRWVLCGFLSSNVVLEAWQIHLAIFFWGGSPTKPRITSFWRYMAFQRCQGQLGLHHLTDAGSARETRAAADAQEEKAGSGVGDVGDGVRRVWRECKLYAWERAKEIWLSIFPLKEAKELPRVAHDG